MKSNQLNKARLLEIMSETYQSTTGNSITKKACSAMLDAMLESIELSIMSEDGVRLEGIGTFSVAQRQATTKPNPKQPGVKVSVPARKVVKFRAAKQLKEKVKTLPVI